MRREKPQGRKVLDLESRIPFLTALLSQCLDAPHPHQISQTEPCLRLWAFNSHPRRSWQPARSGLSVFGPQAAACPAVYSLGTSKADEPQICNSACRDHITTKPPPLPVCSSLREMRMLVSPSSSCCLDANCFLPPRRKNAGGWHGMTGGGVQLTVGVGLVTGHPRNSLLLLLCLHPHPTPPPLL